MAAVHDFARDEHERVAILPAAPEPSASHEINHRIANSLQLLSALVAVGARGIEDPVALAVLDMTRRRIGAIASVHRQLYRTDGAATVVNLAFYLEDLGADLAESCADAAAGRRVIVEAMDISASSEVATSIGIIVSELVGNACKYAYAQGEPGDIHVELDAMPFGGFRLTVWDHGRGFSLDDAPQGTGMGARLVALMAARLGGRQVWHSAQRGTRFELFVEPR